MKAYLRLTWAQLLLFARNKNVLIWSFLLPVLMILAIGTLMGGGGNQFKIQVAMVDEDQSEASQSFIKGLEQVEGIKMSHYSSSEGMQQVKKGEADLLVVIKKGFGTHISDNKSTTDTEQVVLYLDESNPTIAEVGSTLVNQELDQLNKELTNFQPVVTMKKVNVQSRPLTYIDFIVPGILSLMIMSNNLNGVAATIASWRERGILRRMQGTPLSSASFIAGQMTARVLLNGLQALVVLLVAYLFFDVHVYGSWALLIAFVFLGTLTFMSIGFIIASLSKTPESASPIAGLISFPMIFVGGIFFPIRDLPDILQPVVKAIPIGYLTESLRSVMNEGATIVELWIPALVLLGWTLVSFIVAAWSFRWDVD